MISGNFIGVRIDELEDKLAEYYNAYNDVCVYPNLRGILILDWEDEGGESYHIELTPYEAGLKQVVLDSYDFHFNDYIVVDEWVYFLEKNIEIKRREK